MWDIFHPSQPMPGGFPWGVFFHHKKDSKLFWFSLELLRLSHKAKVGLARYCSGGHKTWVGLLIFLSVNAFRYRLWGLIRMIEIIFIYKIPRREVSEQGKYVYKILCILFCSTVWEKKCKNSANCVQVISCTSICRNAQHLIWAMGVSFVIKNKGSCEKLVFLMFY